MRYIPVIGLEIHAEMLTQSKIFCTCSAKFGGEPNSRICPGCAGFPGTLPLLNKGAVELAVKAGIALNCTINETSYFDRKNYFYPDLPNAFQTTQMERPICVNGHLDVGGGKVRINRIHMEEDAGKLIHDDYLGISLADYNRCSVPLIEIVTEPDIKNAQQAKEFVEEVSLRLRYAGVCDCMMEQGSLRVDVNISLMLPDAERFGTRAEVKNLNSYKSIMRAIEYEIERQSALLDKGEPVLQETRRFNDNHGTTKALRSKEEAHDYRYFPDPDILSVTFEAGEIEAIRASMPEMPHLRLARYLDEYALPEADAALIISEKALSDFYDAAVKDYPQYKSVANVMLTELLRRMNDDAIAPADLTLSPQHFAQLVRLADEAVINRGNIKDLLQLMMETGKAPQELAQEHGYIMSTDTGEITQAIAQVLADNPKAVGEYIAGSQKVFGFLMGQVSRRLGKGSNPQLIKDSLMQALKEEETHERA